MNLYASCNLSAMMRPLFWKRMAPSAFSTTYNREYFMLQASRAEANQRVLVRKSLHQLTEYNEEQDYSYLEPVVTLQKADKNWSKMTSNLSEEEVADLEEAREKLRTYEKIYSIYEYATELNELMYVIEAQYASNNPSNPFSIYRSSKHTQFENLIGDIEKALAAYYSLIDDCAGYPDWQHKIELDLGGTVSFLALTIDDVSRDGIVEQSDTFMRFDSEKQKYFK